MRMKIDFEQEILRYLREHSGDDIPPTVREIAAGVGIRSTSTVHKYLGILEEKGYIARRQSEEDGRRRLISLTAQGQAVTETFRTALEETDRAFCAVLSPEEQEQLRDMLTRLIVNLEEEVQHS